MIVNARTWRVAGYAPPVLFDFEHSFRQYSPAQFGKLSLSLARLMVVGSLLVRRTVVRLVSAAAAHGFPWWITAGALGDAGLGTGRPALIPLLAAGPMLGGGGEVGIVFPIRFGPADAGFPCRGARPQPSPVFCKQLRVPRAGGPVVGCRTPPGGWRFSLLAPCPMLAALVRP